MLSEWNQERASLMKMKVRKELKYGPLLGELAWGDGGLSSLPWAAIRGKTLKTWRRQTGSEQEARIRKIPSSA